jgi:hypothetical protein
MNGRGTVGGRAYTPLRAAIYGQFSGPPAFQGRERVLYMF